VVSGSKRNIPHFWFRHHACACRGGLVGCSSGREGRRESILKINEMPTNNLLQCEGGQLECRNLTFDMGDYTSRGSAAIQLQGQQLASGKLPITKSGKWAIIAFGGKQLVIERNYIRRTVPGARPPIGRSLSQEGRRLVQPWACHRQRL